jgi:ubiquinone/menaquinone biosynthesis C-methylase UbiE
MVMKEMKKLNLGCGADIKEGYINLDFMKLPGVDIVHNINQFPWPFKDNEFDLVFASHVLEHVEDLVKTMKELKRICKNNAKIIIRGPHFSCGVSYRDPTHKRFFSYFTFDYFEKGEYNLPKFKIVQKKLNFTRQSAIFLNFFINPFINLIPAIYERFLCWIFPVSEIITILKIKK